MSEIIFQIMTHSMTLKAKHKNQIEREKKALLSCTKKKQEKKNTKMKEKLSTYQDLDGLLNSLEKNFWVISMIGARDVD